MITENEVNNFEDDELGREQNQKFRGDSDEFENLPPFFIEEIANTVFQANNDIEKRFEEYRRQDRYPERIDDDCVNELHEEVQHNNVDEYV